MEALFAEGWFQSEFQSAFPALPESTHNGNLYHDTVPAEHLNDKGGQPEYLVSEPTMVAQAGSLQLDGRGDV